MTLKLLALGLLVDVVAITALAYGIYYRRHGKSDLALAFMALNIGVFAAVALLANAEVGMGFAFGLFGILSIIRLRSTQLSQNEVAYYFISLVFGLINSLGASNLAVAAVLDGVLLLVMLALDSALVGRNRRQHHIILDRAFTDHKMLRQELQYRLGATVETMDVVEIDFVREITEVNVTVREGGESAREDHMLRQVEKEEADAFTARH
ncbi:MAG: DUF4956 domain-containing protein [Actinomycetaceae bacterium]|nr:DUF4956 domain-containing protein [Actinomycetaceae bacterium]